MSEVKEAIQIAMSEGDFEGFTDGNAVSIKNGDGATINIYPPERVARRGDGDGGGSA